MGAVGFKIQQRRGGPPSPHKSGQESVAVSMGGGAEFASGADLKRTAAHAAVLSGQIQGKILVSGRLSLYQGGTKWKGKRESSSLGGPLSTRR